ncbi:MAG: hypothetical protein QM791_20445 [Ferruginibacter sp.]
MKNILVIICLAVLVAGCGKQQPAVEEYTNLEVYEAGGGTPVPGAQVKLMRCSKYDFEFGCQQRGVFATYSTGSDGIARVKNEDYRRADEGIIISKAGYWQQGGSQGRNEICAEGIITATIKRKNAYPDGKHFYLFISDEFHRMTTGNGMEVMDLYPLHDTTVTFKAFASQQNQLKWIVGEKSIIWVISYDVAAEKSLDPFFVKKSEPSLITIEY